MLEMLVERLYKMLSVNSREPVSSRCWIAIISHVLAIKTNLAAYQVGKVIEAHIGHRQGAPTPPRTVSRGAFGLPAMRMRR